MSQAYRHRASICPNCRQMLNGTVDPKDRGAPKPRDLTICIGCGTILRFDERLRLHAITPAELEQLPPKTAVELLEHQERWREQNPNRKSRLLTPRSPR